MPTTPSSEHLAALIARSERSWERILASNAVDDRSTVFPNLGEADFRGRLADMASRYGFRVVGVRWLQPRQAAPLVVLETDDPAAFSRDAPAILHVIDPQAPIGEDWEGWAFEGFFLEARDEDGVPILTVYNHWRGSNRGGGEWARSNALYPFDIVQPVSGSGS